MSRSGSKNTEKKPEARFTKQQLLFSEMYCSQSDLLCALLDDVKNYTLTEAEELMNQFKKGKVKVC